MNSQIGTSIINRNTNQCVNLEIRFISIETSLNDIIYQLTPYMILDCIEVIEEVKTSKNEYKNVWVKVEKWKLDEPLVRKVYQEIITGGCNFQFMDMSSGEYLPENFWQIIPYCTRPYDFSSKLFIFNPYVNTENNIELVNCNEINTELLQNIQSEISYCKHSLKKMRHKMRKSFDNTMNEIISLYEKIEVKNNNDRYENFDYNYYDNLNNIINNKESVHVQEINDEIEDIEDIPYPDSDDVFFVQ